ncbi:MAG TPA: hypothetical protein PKD54_00515 [Pirellulaceae bacterium]|nr:hypothetical protein [Pirellulaceae bacterium]
MIARALLHEIVDYAGLFPPASLGLDDVVSNFGQYVHSEHGWMLGRLVVPVAQLTAFADKARTVWTGPELWRISCLVPAPALADESWQLHLRIIREFNETHGVWARIDTIETKADDCGLITELGDAFDRSIKTFWELPLDDRLTVMVSELASVGKGEHFAKIRMGGTIASAFPPPQQIARFIRTCSQGSVGWKATAGLHHPLRGDYRLTYDPDSPCGAMYGYLNVFFAAAIDRFFCPDESELTACLLADEPSEWEWTDHSIRWQSWTLDESHILETRQRVALSFGSCSFVEPVEEFQTLWRDVWRCNPSLI